MKKNGNKINLMVLIVSMPVGGVETQILSVLEKLDREKYKIFICCIKETGALGAQAITSGIEVISLNTMKSSRFSLKVPHAIAKVMKTNKVHVLWTHQYVANLYGRMATFIIRPPVVISTFHALYDTPKLHRSIFNHLLSGRSDALVAVSGAVAFDMKRYDRVRPEKVKVIYNGISLSKFCVPESKIECRKKFGLPEKDVLIGTVGRFSKEKNQAVIIEALNKLPDNVKGVFVGDGPMRTLLEEAGRGRCHFPGHVEHAFIPYVMKAMDIFCLPSLWEGMSISLVEAMASGLPIIASDISTLREVLGDSGMFSPPDSAEDLASALTLLINDPLRRDRLSEGARARAVKFSIDNTVEAYEKIIEETQKKKYHNEK